MITKAEFQATFEVGGTDALYDVMERECDSARREGEREEYWKQFKTIRGSLITWVWSVTAFVVIVGGGYLIWRQAQQADMRQQVRELRDCSSGSADLCYSDWAQSSDNRRHQVRLRVAYKQATGKDLPAMEISR